MERTNLKLFRVKHKLTQEGMAEKIGCVRASYAAVENGTRTGSRSFWLKFQKAFNIPDSDLWSYIKTDEE